MEWRAGGGQGDHQVAGALRLQLRQHAIAVDRADAEAGEVVVSRAVHARHLRRLAADQGRSGQLAALGYAGDDAGGDLHVELAGGVVVEEQQGLGALGQQVVDAHGDEVDPHGVVQAGLDGHLELGADAVGGRDDQGVVVAGGLEVEQGAETAERRVGAGAAGGLGEGLDALDQGGAGIDVDAGRAVGQAVGVVGHSSGLGYSCLFSHREKKGPAPKAWEDEGFRYYRKARLCLWLRNPSPSQLRWAPPSPYGRGVCSVDRLADSGRGRVIAFQ